VCVSEWHACVYVCASTGVECGGEGETWTGRTSGEEARADQGVDAVMRACDSMYMQYDASKCCQQVVQHKVVVHSVRHIVVVKRRVRTRGFRVWGLEPTWAAEDAPWLLERDEERARASSRALRAAARRASLAASSGLSPLMLSALMFVLLVAGLRLAFSC
jgi:hypothetical protein